jgi:hypothetical protein
MAAHAIYGNKWASIAKLLPGRCEELLITLLRSCRMQACSLLASAVAMHCMRVLPSTYWQAKQGTSAPVTSLLQPL